MTEPDPTVRMSVPESEALPPGAPGSASPPATQAAPTSDSPSSTSGTGGAWAAPARSRRRDGGRAAPIVFGLIVLAAGLWFFAEQTLELDMPDIRWGQFWPVILIVLGAWIVFGSMRGNRR
jgi:hypothetical protein